MTDDIKTIRVYHGYYGCATGCCGHVLEIDGEQVAFDFLHEDGANLDAIKAWVAKKIPPECLATIDWDSLEIGNMECR